MEESQIKFAQANDMIIKLVPPLFIVLGTVSNIISMIITSKKVNISSFMMLIFTINILDTIGLYTEPFWLLLQYWVNSDSTHSANTCKVVLFVYNFVVTCSAWITVYMCFEQASKLCLESKGLITHRKGIILLVTTILISLGINLYFLLHEQNSFQEVSVSSVMCRSPLNKMEAAAHKAREVTTVTYKFNWKWLNKLISFLFPVTFTLACLIAIKQGLETVTQNDTSTSQVVRRSLSLKERENVRLACVTGIMSILSTVPLAFFKTQVSDLKTAKVQLVCTILSLLIYMNFAMKLVYFCAVSSIFRKNVCYMFKTHAIAQKIRKLSSFHDPRSVELLGNSGGEARLHLEETSSDTESNMSISPLGATETVQFSFNRDSENVELTNSEC